MMVFDELPGEDRWEALLGAPKEGDWEVIYRAVAFAYDHQSERATDVRWMRGMTEINKGRVHFAPHLEKLVEGMLNYSEREDFREVGSRIRAFEMITRGLPEKRDPSPWLAQFWSEAFHRTECIPSNPDEGVGPRDEKSLADSLEKAGLALLEHYMASITTTAVDARHECAFGIVFYILHLTYFALWSAVGMSIQGRLCLRTIVEAYIILVYLGKKDDPTIWMQYRNYGSSQAKLAFLKFKEEDAPDFVTKQLLETLANSDVWMEYQNIKLGAWADKNLRKMAEEAGIKDFYDKYYDALSGYTHGNWSAVTHSVFGTCMNPLHRFHRIPFPPRFFKEDSSADMVKIVNLALEQIAMLYPPFKQRVRAENSDGVNPA
jgi:hypothetical protein